MTLIKTGRFENYSVITLEIRLSSLLSLVSVLTDFLECHEPAKGGGGGESGEGERERGREERREEWREKENYEKRKKSKKKKKRNPLPVFANWLCAGVLLQCLARLFTTLPQPSLTACTEPRNQSEVEA